ncbi:MAG: S41 family peptidase [Bacilli bacterium]|nr:S41 family peptidase [Bacilli bacterium]
MNGIKKTTKRISRKKKSDNEVQNNIKELNSTKIDGEKKNEISSNKKKDTTKNSNSNKKILKNKKKQKKKKFGGVFTLDVLDLLIIVVIVAIFSCLTTGAILNARFHKTYSIYGRDVVSDENLSNFIKTYSEVVDNFYEEVDSEGMIEAALDGMMNYLEDNYSIYMNKEDSENLNETLDSSYEGIGTHALGNVIIQVYEGSPADKAGIKVNDVVVEINGNEINEENYYLMADYLNETGEDNEVVVERDGKKISFTLSKAVVDVPVVYTKVIEKNDKNIGYISLSQFSSRSTSEFQDGLIELEKEEITSLIIDLRDNSGGYLTSANEISSIFLEKGKVIYSLENKNETKEFKDETDEYKKYPVVVLVNSSTASASEILTAALKDSYGATIVGNVTFGKGKVQNLMHYNDTMVKYTSAKWLRPNGECVDGIGIEPDYNVNITVKNNIIYDNQLDKAISLLEN